MGHTIAPAVSDAAGTPAASETTTTLCSVGAEQVQGFRLAKVFFFNVFETFIKFLNIKKNIKYNIATAGI